MASPQASNHFFSNNHVQMYDFDYAADPVDVAWVDMQNYRRFVVGLFRSVGTATVDGFRILANTAADGSGTDIVVKVHALGTAPDAVGDQIYLECTAEEVMQEATDAGITGARYVTASVELNGATDEAVVLYILSEPRFAHDGLTADIIA